MQLTFNQRKEYNHQTHFLWTWIERYLKFQEWSLLALKRDKLRWLLHKIRNGICALLKDNDIPAYLSWLNSKQSWNNKDICYPSIQTRSNSPLVKELCKDKEFSKTELRSHWSFLSHKACSRLKQPNRLFKLRFGLSWISSWRKLFPELKEDWSWVKQIPTPHWSSQPQFSSSVSLLLLRPNQ